MKNIFLTNILCCLCLLTFAQDKTEGIVVYERTSYWAKIQARLTYLSQEEKDRAAQTWKNDSEWTEKMKLAFNATQSLYTFNSEQGESKDGTYTWRHEDYVIQRNFEQDKKTELIEMLGKTYVLEDSLHTPNWKIMNQLKEINGYLCMKATADDAPRGQKITAWFSMDIPVQAGPERYFGLPGLILELDINEGDVVMTATSIEFKKLDKELALPKLKGKKIKDNDYNLLISNHIKTSMEAHQNPFWSIRY